MSYAKFEHTRDHQNINLCHLVIYLYVCVCKLQTIPLAYI